MTMTQAEKIDWLMKQVRCLVANGPCGGGTDYVTNQDNFVRVLYIDGQDLSGVGTMEEQICEYILALPESERTIAETDSKWNVLIYGEEISTQIYEIINIGKGIIVDILPDNLLLITELTSSGNIVHNETSGKQGGSVLLNEFYHSTKAEHDLLEEITANDTIDKILGVIKVAPTYIPPSSSIVKTPTTTLYEVGASAPVSIIQTFFQEDAGPKIEEAILKNNSIVSNTNTFSETLNPVPLGSTTYSGTVTYAEGPCKLDNLGIVDCTGHILAGQTVSNSIVITGGLRRFAGSVSTLPADGTALRTALLGTSVINTANSFTFTTGTTNRRFVIAIPASKTLVSAINTGTNELLNFTLSGSITQVPDAAGTMQTYKVYTLENAVAFSTNYTINVILS